MGDDKAWFVVRTNPNCERKAAGELRRASLHVYVPKQSFEVLHRRSKKVEVKTRPLLVGYLFVRFPDQMRDHRGVPHFAIARACQGVKGLLTAMNEVGEWAPFPIPEKSVAEFMRRQRLREFGRPAVDTTDRKWTRLKATFTKGRQMRIADGPFASFMATIENLMGNGSVTAMVTIFGQETRVGFSDPERELAAVSERAVA